MEGQIDVSVIIPVRNEHPMRLRMALASLTTQTYRGFEVLVCFDGPDQKALEALQMECQLYLRTHSTEPKVKTLINPTGGGTGCGRPRNLIYQEHALGKYIAFLDSDDMMVPHSLMWRKNFLDRNPDYHAVDSWTTTHGYKRQIIRHGFYDGWESVPEDPFKIYPSTIMIRREIYDRIQWCEEPWTRGGGEDQMWYTDFYYGGYLGGTIQSPLNVRTKHSIPGSVKWTSYAWPDCRKRSEDRYGEDVWRTIMQNTGPAYKRQGTIHPGHCL